MKKIVIHFTLFLIIILSICKESYPQLGESWYYFCKSEKILAFAEMEDILWIGCYNGLVKYSKSSQEFQVFNKANSSITDNHIVSLAVDYSNTLWIVTDNGKVNTYNNGTWQIIDTLTNLFTSYSDVVVDNDNRKWFFASSNAVIFDDINWSIHSFNSTSITCGFLSQDGSIWLGSSSALIKVIGSDTSYFNLGLPWGEINAISEDSQNNIWFNKGENLIKFDQTLFTIYNESNSNIINSRINSLDITSDDKIVMSTYKYWNGSENILGGLQIFDGDEWTMYDTTNSEISSYTAQSVFVDDNGIIWVGTRTNLDKFNQNIFESIWISNSELPDNYIKDITCYQYGLSYYATEAGVIGFDWNNWSEVIDFNADVICQNPLNGDLWMATNYMLVKYSEGIIQEYTTPYNHENMNPAGDLIVDLEGNIWLGYSAWAEWDPMNGWIEYPGGVYRFDGNNWIDYNSSNSVITSQSHSISVDDVNIIWFSNGYGITKKEGISWTTYNSTNTNLPSNCSYITFVDHNNYVWTTIGYSDDLAVYDGIEWTILESGNQQNSSLYSLAEDSYGNIWGIGLNRLIKYDGYNWIVYNRSNSPIPYNIPYFLGVDSYDNVLAGSNGIIVHNENGIYVALEENDNIIKNFKVNVFPNPGMNIITLSIPKEAPSQKIYIEFFDLKGRLLNIPYQTNQRNKMINIDLDVNNLATGQYIYKLVFENIKQSGKFIIVK